MEDVGTFELQVSNDAKYAISLFDDNFILIDEKRVGIITNYSIDKMIKRTVKGFQLKRFWVTESLLRRQIQPMIDVMQMQKRL